MAETRHTNQEQAQPRHLKEYQKPKLIKHGDILNLTHGALDPPGDVGATGIFAGGGGSGGG